jgi:hypothetical protein
MAPQSLGGQNLRVKYNNPLARAQKMEDVAAIERLNQGLTILAELGQTVPAAAASLDVVNFDENIRTVVDGLGVPLKNVNTPDQVQALRDQRQQAQAQAAQAAKQDQMQTMAADAAMQRSVKAA